MTEKLEMPVEDFAIAVAKENARLVAEIECIQIENIQMKFALGYPMPSKFEKYIIPTNPFKCGICDAKIRINDEPR
jgi:hypothetical protein